jgi:Ser/Thr protein kinase RdoA (MazF antagonist)
MPQTPPFLNEPDHTPLVARALKLYGVSPTRIHAPQKGYRNSSYKIATPAGPLNFILYKNEPGMLARISRTNNMGDFLHAHGLPARRTASAHILQIKNSAHTRYGALYYYLSGQTIPWEAYTMDHLKMLGKTMSQMHAELVKFPEALPSVVAELTALNGRMLNYFADANVARALGQKLGLVVVKADFTKIIAACQKLPTAQALHMDFVRGNILFDGTNITGILDFEKAAYGPPVFDIARTLAFLLVDCKYKQASKIVKYFLQSGYNKRGSVKFTDWSALWQLLPFFLLHDFYKFLRHNPYESLTLNQHFICTKVLLVKLGVLSVK